MKSGAYVVSNARKLEFAGVGGRDVYNPTAPFKMAGRTIIAGRVESRESETDSTVTFFEERGGVWNLLSGAPTFAMQDPFVTQIGDETILGGVAVEPRSDGTLRYRTVFYRGTSPNNLIRFASGPWGMKDIRLKAMDNGRILVLTRPQGRKGGRGKIGIATIGSLDQLTARNITRAPIIPGLFLDDEWGGANEINRLGPEQFEVLGHIARFDARGDRHYYPMSFGLDLKAGRAEPLRILLERRDLPGGLKGAFKKKGLRDVLFSGGMREGTIFVGAGDVEVYRADIPSPFTTIRGK